MVNILLRCLFYPPLPIFLVSPAYLSDLKLYTISSGEPFSDLQTEPGSSVIYPLYDILYFFFLAFTYVLLYYNNNNSYYTILYNYLISVSHLECKLCEYKDQVYLNFLLTAILPVPGLVPCTRGLDSLCCFVLPTLCYPNIQNLSRCFLLLLFLGLFSTKFPGVERGSFMTLIPDWLNQKTVLNCLAI